MYATYFILLYHDMLYYATYIFKEKQKNFLLIAVIERTSAGIFIQGVSNKRIALQFYSNNI